MSYLDRSKLVDILPRVVYEAEFFEGIDIVDTCVSYFGYREAKDRGFKVALCGEGSDEILAGYDLFRTHPDKPGMMKYRVHNLHRTDLQRVDRASMMNSIEARVPFLDRWFLEFAYQVPMELKIVNGIEKWILREAFRDELPPYVANRRKVRLPDGSGVKNMLMQYADQPVALDAGVRRMLELDTPQAAFFLNEYLKAGFRLPTERFKKAGYDYSPHGYFTFVS